MLKKTLLFFAFLFISVGVHAAEMVNVEYIHSVIKQHWDITIPYNSALTNPKVAANMKYLLTAIDVANENLNGTKITNYSNGEYATTFAADTAATNTAVRTLIKEQVDTTPKFFITTKPTTTSFKFKMSAKGHFAIDWGDGTMEKFNRKNTSEATYSHTYATARDGGYTIGIGGLATEYSTTYGSYETTAAISFRENTDIVAIDGSLGAIFQTIGDGSANGQQPRFYSTFNGCWNMVNQIPENLFDGVTGQPAEYMFRQTFNGCSKLSGKIPEKLFAGIKGAPAEYMFSQTFSGCSKLSGKIPEKLFAGIKGAPAKAMFQATFYSCYNLSGEIPGNLFAGISGAPAEDMFYMTFYSCRNLSGEIPENLFAGIKGAPKASMFSYTFFENYKLSGIQAGLFKNISGAPAAGMFYRTFSDCINMTGSIPVGLFSGIKGAPKADMFNSTFYNCSKLSGEIPAGLFSGIKGAPAASMFNSTFYNCSKLSGEIPAGLFGTLTGTPAKYMFNLTFNGCSNLSGEIPTELFGTISGTAATGMFTNTFNGCSTLSGPSTKIGAEYLYEIWPNATTTQVGQCYRGATQLTDYNSIPSAWK